MRRPRRLPSISSLSAGHTSRWAAGHTEEGDCATRPREDAHGAHVLLAHCVLHARDDGSGRCRLQSGLDCLREGIYGAVCLHLLLINIGFCGHGGRIGRSGRVCRRGLALAMAVRYNEVAASRARASVSNQTTLARAFLPPPVPPAAASPTRALDFCECPLCLDLFSYRPLSTVSVRHCLLHRPETALQEGPIHACVAGAAGASPARRVLSCACCRLRMLQRRQTLASPTRLALCARQTLHLFIPPACSVRNHGSRAALPVPTTPRTAPQWKCRP
jgi:hypothetical protein